ncbi:hypothetical protein ARMGADRAFT_1029419 [Armillaria gallica]|uniref:Uncharacterized protein n=1 Tax=Armillaria gallica TaxID=47427 RepID=A0A2H3DGD4_ARMGA|nr:hypothetical protein ARMGADRAFT_1029419 [Armillaria gallica]
MTSPNLELPVELIGAAVLEFWYSEFSSKDHICMGNIHFQYHAMLNFPLYKASEMLRREFWMGTRVATSMDSDISRFTAIKNLAFFAMVKIEKEHDKGLHVRQVLTEVQIYRVKQMLLKEASCIIKKVMDNTTQRAAAYQIL